MAGEKDFIGNFVVASRFVTSATQNGILVHRGVFPYAGPHYHYVDTGQEGGCNFGVLYTDSISWCSGLALWSQGKAGLIHIVPAAGMDVEGFLASYDNGAAALPGQIFIATQPAYAPPYHDDADASQRSLYEAARALENHYGAGVTAVTTIVTGYRGRSWSHAARLSVSAANGVSIAIP